MLSRAITITTLLLFATVSAYANDGTISSDCLTSTTDTASCATFNIYNDTASMLGLKIDDVQYSTVSAGATVEFTLPETDTLHIYYTIFGDGTTVSLSQSNNGQYLACHNKCYGYQFTCALVADANAATDLLNDPSTGGALNSSACLLYF